MKVLVTGAGRMVGSHMVEMLYVQGHQVIDTYYKPTTDIREISCEISVFETVKKKRAKDLPSYGPLIVAVCPNAEHGETINHLEVNAIYAHVGAPLMSSHFYGISKVGQDLVSFQYFMNDHIRCIRAKRFNS